MGRQNITDDLPSLLDILPPDIAEVIKNFDRDDEFLEVILDLGRVPTARFLDGEYVLRDQEVTEEDIELIVLQIGEFDADNRAGIERTLHRISGIRNRRGDVVGLTCRVGRAVFGTIDIIKDLVESGRSILILGKPGVGKTTMLREAARVLAESKRVVIVDTSNEIGGDGDVAHPAIGKARRMQVPTPSLQHEVMIEAVENHNPEVIIIDEIGRELETQAARTIAERGVQLIGTAHGVTLDNLLLNPTLSDLVGGIESVTLSDEEARRRGTQKTVLERRAPSTFEVLIELQDRNTLHIHPDIMQSVDLLLRGVELQPEIRRRGGNGEIIIEEAKITPQRKGKGNNRQASQSTDYRPRRGNNGTPVASPEQPHPAPAEVSVKRQSASGTRRNIRVYPYGIARNRLIEAARQFGLQIQVVDNLNEADVLLTLKNFYRHRPRLIEDAEQSGLPIYVLRSNTVTQIEDFLVDFFELEVTNRDNPLEQAIRETEEAIQTVLNGAASIDLAPQKASIRRQQHELVRQANLLSHSYGKEPVRHLRVYRE
ncbi:MAG: AAA family ATPase [Anaerolineae bacterium]|nr:AAA family ATPase [Anaerolineae bacterium]